MAWSVVFDVMPATILPLDVKVPSRRISPPFLSSTVGGDITYSLPHVDVAVHLYKLDSLGLVGASI